MFARSAFYKLDLMKEALFSAITFTTLAILVLLYMTEVGADVVLAMIEAVTPPDGR